MNDLRTYLAGVTELPRDVLLGYIVIYKVNDAAYELDKLTNWFTELNLNPGYLPSAAKPIDAYKKATADANNSEYTLLDGNTAHILVRDVGSDTEMVERHLIREIKDSTRRTLAHSKIGEAVFYRPKISKGKAIQDSHRFRLQILHGNLVDKSERTPLDAVVQKISDGFDRHLNYLDGMKVRHMVREYVKGLNGIELKPSMYFIPVSRADELEQLAELMNRLGHGCNMQLIPLVELKKQKDMIIEAYQKDAEKSFTDLVEKVTHLRATRKSVTPDAFAKLMSEYEAINARAAEYRTDLSVTQDRTTGAAEIAKSALSALARSLMEGAA
jgi:hypothetical protein